MHATLEPAKRSSNLFSRLPAAVRAESPTLLQTLVAIVSAVLLIVSFPDFNLWPLAWIALVPLLVVLAREPKPVRSFFLGWLTGSVFFYCSCYWLTFSMIHYGGLSPLIAYLLLLPGALTVGIFPGFFAIIIATAIKLLRAKGVLLAPFIWPAMEWARLSVTGQLWNALGYSQAYQPALIQTAKWGGVYAVGFLILAVNSAIAFAVLHRSKRSIFMATSILTLVVVTILLSNQTGALQTSEIRPAGERSAIRVLALQPNVPMTLVKSDEEMKQLMERHVRLSEALLRQAPDDGVPRLLVWPESPMNFEYARNLEFQTAVTNFAREHKTSLLFNSQEPAPNGGIYNSAILINEDGRLFGQYDKIRLLPFGEYVPLPRWLPGASLITAIVGDFTPGANYTMFRVGKLQTGTFICVESAYPSIARAFSKAGADALINISNDGYLGRTAVMKQHLANAVFRAVENGRPLARVTNTGITALIDKRGNVSDETETFTEATRTWTIDRQSVESTFYTRHGDLFVLIVTVISVVLFAIPVFTRRKRVFES